MMRQLVGLMAMIALSGCGGSTIWHGDVTFTASERVRIERGAAFVTESSGSEPIDIVWDLPHDLEGVRQSIYRGRWGFMADEQAGYCRRGRIALDVSMLPDETLAVAAAHEFGHFLGYEHHSGPGVMGPQVTSSLTWTNEDRDSR